MIFADMHCDTITKLHRERKKGSMETLKNNSLHLDLCKMKKADYLLQNFAVFINKEKSDNPYRDCLENIQFFKEEIKRNEDLILPAQSYEQIEQNKTCGKMSALLTLEEGAVLKGDVSTLHEFYDLGVRMITITWNYSNELGYPNVDLMPYLKKEIEKPNFTNPETKKGLTETGIHIIEEMGRLGIIIDVSHGSDALFYDVCRYTKKPFVASHSNARAICHHNRNLSDDMIRTLALRGGVMGMNFCADFLNPDAHGKCYIHDIIVHMQYIKNIGGVEVIGLGSDFDGIEDELEMKDASGMVLLLEEMHRSGFTMSEIDKITHENVLRVYKELL